MNAMLSADEARQLERLAIAAGSASAGGGRRTLKTRGQSIEFHDFRAYQPGDDPRSIDWTVDARLRQLVVRMFRAEGHVPLHLLVDTSASMGIGATPKLDAARRAAAALAYVAVLRHDPLALANLGETVRLHVPPASGRPQLFRVFSALAAARAEGRSSLDRALMHYGAGVRGPGLAIVLSDFFDPDLTLDGVSFLLHRGFTPALVQVIADEEVQPRFAGEAEIVDVEDPAAPPVVVDPRALADYDAQMTRATDRLRTFCAERGLPFARLVSSCSFSGMVAACTGAGLLELRV